MKIRTTILYVLLISTFSYTIYSFVSKKKVIILQSKMTTESSPYNKELAREYAAPTDADKHISRAPQPAKRPRAEEPQIHIRKQYLLDEPKTSYAAVLFDNVDKLLSSLVSLTTLIMIVRDKKKTSSTQ